MVVSPIVQDEIEKAPENVRQFFDEITELAKFIDISEEALQLRKAYLDAGIVTPKSAADAFHVALATVAGCRLIISWNFKHIVDEVAGIYALDRLLPNIEVLSGTLIVFPSMNILACNANKRYINKDLNSVFPGHKNAKFYEFKLAQEIYEMVGREKVQYLLTLHESKYLYDPKKSGTIAQTIIYGVKPQPSYLTAWLDSVNNFTSDKEKFHPLYFPKEGSST